MPDAPLISAIVLNYRTPQHAVRCVQALQAQTIADQIEILVVDNNSEDDSIGVLRNHFMQNERVRIIETPENLGYGKGNNFAARYAKGNYIFIINPDNVLEPTGLEKMIQLLESDESIGIVAPQLAFNDGYIRDSYRPFPSIWESMLRRICHKCVDTRYSKPKSHELKRQDVDWVVGACFLIHRDLFRSLGGFDDRFFLFFEDMDLCRRCWQLHKRVVFEPTVKAIDKKSRLSGGGLLPLLLKSVGRQHVVSALQYFWKWRGKSASFR